MRKSLLAASLAVVAVVVAAACQPTKPPTPQPPNVDVLVVGDSVSAGLGCQLGDPGQLAPPGGCPANGTFGFTTKAEWAGACSVSGGWLMQYNRVSHNTPHCWDWQFTYPSFNQYDPELVIFLTGGWEIQDRWANQPCNTSNVFNCPAPDRQWANPSTFGLAPAKAAYRAALLGVIDVFRDADTQVLVVNSAYVNPPIFSNPPIWWEAYGPDPPGLWQSPNQNTPFGPSKIKVDNFNSELEDAVDSLNDAGVEWFDLWDYFSPQIGGAREWSNDICIDLDTVTGDPLEDVAVDPANCESVGAEATAVRDPDGGHFNGDGNRVFVTAILPTIQDMLP